MIAVSTILEGVAFLYNESTKHYYNMNDKIFTPFKLGTHTIKNRIIRSATNDHLGNLDGTVSDVEIEICH